MPHDPHLAELMRDALASRPGISEKKMFGGYCWMLNGNMLCGVEVARSKVRRMARPQRLQMAQCRSARVARTIEKIAQKSIELPRCALCGVPDDPLERFIAEDRALDLRVFAPPGAAEGKLVGHQI